MDNLKIAKQLLALAQQVTALEEPPLSSQEVEHNKSGADLVAEKLSSLEDEVSNNYSPLAFALGMVRFFQNMSDSSQDPAINAAYKALLESCKGMVKACGGNY